LKGGGPRSERMEARGSVASEGFTKQRRNCSARSRGRIFACSGVRVCGVLATSIGGLARSRTGLEGFAVLCVAVPPRGLCPKAGPPAYTKDSPLPQDVVLPRFKSFQSIWRALE